MAFATAGANGGTAGSPTPSGEWVLGTIQVSTLGDWAIDRTEVTISQFERYVQATGTVTRAEKEGGGFEFGAGWERRPGWTWRQPDGVPAKAELPAVHLDFAEAQAYCRYARRRRARSSRAA